MNLGMYYMCFHLISERVSHFTRIGGKLTVHPLLLRALCPISYRLCSERVRENWWRGILPARLSLTTKVNLSPSASVPCLKSRDISQVRPSAWPEVLSLPPLPLNN